MVILMAQIGVHKGKRPFCERYNTPLKMTKCEFESHWPVINKTDRNGISRNVFKWTAPWTLPYVLWGCDFDHRDEQWAHECMKTFKDIPEMPVVVSASQMSIRWGCSHTWAKRLIKSDWDWISITTKHFVHNSHMQPFTQIHKACMDSKNPLSCFHAVNLLRKYKGQPYEKNLVDYMGFSKFSILRVSKILKPLHGLNTRHKIYYVPRTWFKSGRDQNHTQGNIHE